jgi:hypothetical protein
MVQQVVKIAKIGKNAHTATDPNDFIFHSAYNTFKIIDSGIYSPTITASSTEIKTLPHGLFYTPMVHAFAKATGYNSAMLPNEKYTAVVTDVITFHYVESDANNLYFKITNHTGSDLVVNIKYYIFEVPL